MPGAGCRVTRPEDQALVGRGRLAGAEVALAKPLTYMNLSGESVKALASRYEAKPEDVIVGANRGRVNSVRDLRDRAKRAAVLVLEGRRGATVLLVPLR